MSFDEKSAYKKLSEFVGEEVKPTDGLRYAAIDLARWQFEQDSVRIKELEQSVDLKRNAMSADIKEQMRLSDLLDAANRRIQELEQQVEYTEKVLTQQSNRFDLAIAERDSLVMDCMAKDLDIDSLHSKVAELEEKLEQIATENKELRQTLQYRDEDVPILRKTIADERERIAELEVELEEWRSPYCKECGSCGEEGCCPGKNCKYPESKANEEILTKLETERERSRRAIELIKEKVMKHREAYGLDIFPNSEKLDENSTRESIAAAMGRHMCDCFMQYIAETLAELGDGK